MLVKICGIRSLADARPAIEEGADYIGIILVPNRARTIDHNAVKELSAYLRQLPLPRPRLVGVFRKQPLNEILQLTQDLQLDSVQLHGSEPTEWIDSIPVPVIKRCVPGTPSFTQEVLELNNRADITMPLVDSEQGGDGKVLNWSNLAEVGLANGQFVLAGGLTPENVHLATEVRGCIGVDVSGGVETNGMKDEQKVRQFVRNAKLVK